ncbi:MAG: hemerythrin domain-containing protein, partial [Candidatus Hydrogenedentes bacterium]|nr:hemerythrin domain-containing protein [Candidatus Hydrogenedentota bacterium]
HMFAEEQLFYPFLMDHADDREPVHEAIEEHRSARIVMSDVESTPVDDESWHPKLKVLYEQIDHHIQEEETDIFELAHEFVDEDMAHDLGQKFQALKKEARAERMEIAGSRR